MFTVISNSKLYFPVKGTPTEEDVSGAKGGLAQKEEIDVLGRTSSFPTHILVVCFLWFNLFF